MLNGLVLVGLVTSHFLFFLERRKLMKHCNEHNTSRENCWYLHMEKKS